MKVLPNSPKSRFTQFSVKFNPHNSDKKYLDRWYFLLESSKQVPFLFIRFQHSLEVSLSSYTGQFFTYTDDAALRQSASGTEEFFNNPTNHFSIIVHLVGLVYILNCQNPSVFSS